MSLFGAPDIKKLQSTQNVKLLIKALNYRKKMAIRRSAAEALGNIGDPRACDALISALNDPEDEVRGEACEALGKIGDLRATLHLISALTNPGERTRQGSVKGLGLLADSRAIDALHTALYFSFKDKARYYVMEDIVWALKQIGDKRSLKPLIDALEHAYHGTLVQVLEALAKLGDTCAVMPILQEDHSRYEYGGDISRLGKVTQAKIRALGALGDPRAVGYLTMYLGMWSTPIESIECDLACRALVKIGQLAIGELEKKKVELEEQLEKEKGNEGLSYYQNLRVKVGHLRTIIDAINNNKSALSNLHITD